MKEQARPAPEDELSALIREVVPRDKVNSTRVLFEEGTIYKYNENTEETEDEELDPREAQKWRNAWDGRLISRTKSLNYPD